MKETITKIFVIVFVTHLHKPVGCDRTSWNIFRAALNDDSMLPFSSMYRDRCVMYEADDCSIILLLIPLTKMNIQGHFQHSL